MGDTESLQILYFSSVLAKALQESDGDKFTELYDLMCKKALNEEVEIAIDKARDLANLSPEELSRQISMLEKNDVEPLHCSKISLNDDNISKEVKNNDMLMLNHEHTFSLQKDTSLKNNDRESTSEFDMLNRNERSLVHLQNRTTRTQLCENKDSFQPISTVSQCINSERQSIVVPSPSVGKSVSVKANEVIHSKSSQNKPLSLVSERPNCSKQTAVCSMRENCIKDDVSTCVDFNLTKSYVKIDSKKVQDNKLRSTECPKHSTSEVSSKGIQLLAQPSSIWAKSRSSSSGQEINSKKSKKDNKQSSITSKALNNSNLAIQNLDEKKIGLSPGNNKELYPKVNSTKPKRRSIKEYKREKLKQSADKNFDTDQVPLSANVQSKALQRKQREQNKLELLPDVKVNEILLECGETGGIPDKSKPDIYKKNKKMKKQKKAAKKIKEKHKTVEDSPLITYDMKETEVFEQVLSLSVGDAPSDEDIKDGHEFIVKKKKKDLHKTTFQTTRTAQVPNELKRASEKNSSKGKLVKSSHSTSQFGRSASKKDETVVKISPDLKSDCQWQNLVVPSTLFDASSSETGAVTFSTRFKTTLDSTGCSVASSSEDGSCTSSNSSGNYCSSASDIPSPELVSHSADIVCMSSSLLKSGCVKSPIGNDFVSLDSVQLKDNKKDSNKRQDNTDNQTVSATCSNFDSTCNKNSALVDKNGSTKKVGAVEEREKIEKIQAKSSSSKSKSEENALFELKNKWGLDFFYEENSLPAAERVSESLNLEQQDTKLCFGLGNSDSTLPITANENVSAKLLRRNTEKVTVMIKSSISFKDSEINYASFNFQEATAVLMTEWKLALAEGQVYGES